jgi:hypothetical protein
VTAGSRRASLHQAAGIFAGDSRRRTRPVLRGCRTAPGAGISRAAGHDRACAGREAGTVTAIAFPCGTLAQVAGQRRGVTRLHWPACAGPDGPGPSPALVLASWTQWMR